MIHPFYPDLEVSTLTDFACFYVNRDRHESSR